MPPLTDAEVRAAFPPGVTRDPWLSPRVYHAYLATRREVVLLFSLRRDIWARRGWRMSEGQWWLDDDLEWREHACEYEAEYLFWCGGR